MQSLRWYDKNSSKRMQIADEIRADAGESEFGIAESVRVAWIPDQRADPAIRHHFDQPGNGFRVAPDGVLERHVNVTPPIGPLWVPIVPRGHAMAHVSWKRWCFLQVHVGRLLSSCGVVETVLPRVEGVACFRCSSRMQANGIRPTATR